jgi:Mn-containing catalase
MATPIEEPRELLVHQLRTMLWVEQKLADDVLPELFEVVHSTDLRWDVERHIHETKGHVKNLRHVFAKLEEPGDPVESPTLLALKKEHDTLLKQASGDDEALQDLVHADAIARTEHFELAAYTGIVHLGKALDIGLDAVTLLRENMEQEAHALEQVEHALAKLLAEKVESRLG